MQSPNLNKIIIQYDCKRGTVWWGGKPAGRKIGKEKVMGVEYDWSTL
jgi:hypothetical protein